MVRFLSILALLVAFSPAFAQVDSGGLDGGGDGGIPGGGGVVDPPITGTVPEPGTLALFGLGVVAVGLISRRRRK